MYHLLFEAVVVDDKKRSVFNDKACKHSVISQSISCMCLGLNTDVLPTRNRTSLCVIARSVFPRNGIVGARPSQVSQLCRYRDRLYAQNYLSKYGKCDYKGVIWAISPLASISWTFFISSILQVWPIN